MKKIVTGIALLSFSSLSFAGVSAVGRFDYKNLKTKSISKVTNTTTSTFKDTSGEYEVNLARILTAAKINDSLTFDMELDLKQASGTKSNGGALNDFVDSMVLTKNFGENFSVKVGKQDPLVGGFEWTVADADIYSASSFYANAPLNSVGLSGHYSFLGHTLSLVHLETTENLPANTTAQDRKVTGALLAGTYLDGMLSTRLSYHKSGITVTPSATSDVKSDLTAIGFQIDKNMFVVQLDYLMAKNKDAGTTDASVTTDAKLTSLVAHVRYNHENYKPFVKYIMDKSKGSYELTRDVAGAESKRSVIEVGMEYVPNKNEDMRYHVVYSSAETKQDTAATGVTVRESKKDDTFFAGVKFGFNLL